MSKKDFALNSKGIFGAQKGFCIEKSKKTFVSKKDFVLKNKGKFWCSKRILHWLLMISKGIFGAPKGFCIEK